MFKHSLSKKICGLISLIITGFIVPGYAEITLDGSLGTASTLPGPDYMIGAELGRQKGNNLFHSFGEFNINTGDSATFTGPAHIENIIGRVTGGNPSLIDGALNSTIPSADLYLLNPNGVMMGPNAKLDIDGSFHLSSADYLRFADGQRFEANTKVSPLLIVAPPEAFGFLDKMGDIKIIGSKLENGDKDFSVMAGNLLIVSSDIRSTTLDGQAGHILLQAANSIQIAASTIVSETQSGGSGHAGNIMLKSPIIVLDDHIEVKGVDYEPKNTQVSTRTTGTGDGGYVQIDAPLQLIISNSAIFAQTEATGNAGDITLNVGKLTFQDGGRVNASSAKTATGNGGNITVNVRDSATIIGHSPPLPPDGRIQPSAIGSSAFGSGDSGTIRITAQTLNLDKYGTIQTLTKGFGDAGDIKITVHDLKITHGADIDASNEGNGYSKSGDIDITATGNVFITAEPVTSEETLRLNEKFVYNNHLGGVYSIAEKTGHGGNIKLTAGKLTLRDNGVISAKSTAYTGDGGNININTNELYISGGDAWIDVSSEFGLNGEFILNSTKLKDDFLGIPPPQFQDARLTYNRCASMSRENLSRFLIITRDILPPSPEDLRTHLYMPEM